MGKGVSIKNRHCGPDAHYLCVCISQTTPRSSRGQVDTSDALGCSSLQLAFSRRALGDEAVPQWQSTCPTPHAWGPEFNPHRKKSKQKRKALTFSSSWTRETQAVSSAQIPVNGQGVAEANLGTGTCRISGILGEFKMPRKGGKGEQTE